jgi:hypothetical protein
MTDALSKTGEWGELETIILLLIVGGIQPMDSEVRNGIKGVNHYYENIFLFCIFFFSILHSIFLCNIIITL